jgi:cell wall-associated NlpC family hydrolase
VRGKSLMIICVLFALALSAVPSAMAAEGPGGVAYEEPTPEPAAPTGADVAQPTVPGVQAKLLASGLAAAPEAAPDAVKQAIWAANGIIGRPYRYGGGHARGFVDRGYDCSGTVSVALHGGDLLDSPLDSTSFMHWGAAGAGQWMTVYTNPGHAYAVIAGLRLDTSAAGDPSGAKGPRWRPALRSSHGFKARHPVGL